MLYTHWRGKISSAYLTRPEVRKKTAWYHWDLNLALPESQPDTLAACYAGLRYSHVAAPLLYSGCDLLHFTHCMVKYQPSGEAMVAVSSLLCPHDNICAAKCGGHGFQRFQFRWSDSWGACMIPGTTVPLQKYRNI